MTNEELTPEMCARIIGSMSPVINDKIVTAFITALDDGFDLIARDGTSPAGEKVMAHMNADLARLGFSDHARKIMRLNVRVIGLTILRDAFAAAV